MKIKGRNRFGFTLIELLAIIVILAIIAVITVPIILNIVEKSKIGAAKDSAYGYKDAIQKSYLSNMFDDYSNSKLDGNYLINSDGNLTDNDGNVIYNVLLSGTIPNGGYLNIEGNVISSGCIQIDEYAVGISNGKVLNPNKGVCGSDLYEDIAVSYKNNVDSNGSILPDGRYIINSDGRLRDLTGVVVLDSIDSNPTGGYLVIDNHSVVSGCLQVGNYKVNVVGGNISQPTNGICEQVDIPTPVVYSCSDSSYVPDDESWFTTMLMGNDLYITGYSDNHPSDNTDLRLPCTIDGTAVSGVFNSAFDNKRLTSVVIPDGIKYLYNGAFQDNELISVAVPGSVETIYTAAFSENQIRKLSLNSGLKQISSFAFVNNKIEELNVPSSVTNIGNGAFNGNLLEGSSAFIYDLNDSTKIISYAGKDKDVTIPSNVFNIGVGAFQSCGLTSVVIPDSVTTIDNQAFQDNKLINVLIPDSVTTLGQSAFQNNSLREVTIGRNVASTNRQNSAFLKNATSNSDLTTVHNLTGHSFYWGSMINSSSSNGPTTGMTFDVGTVINNYGNVTILGE